jgi:hypothetical protein
LNTLFRRLSRDFSSGTRTWMGHVIEHIALEIQKAVWTQDLVELMRLKHLGPTMLFSVIPKRTLTFLPLRCRILNQGTEYDLKAIYKKCEKSGNVFA